MATKTDDYVKDPTIAQKETDKWHRFLGVLAQKNPELAKQAKHINSLPEFANWLKNNKLDNYSAITYWNAKEQAEAIEQLPHTDPNQRHTDTEPNLVSESLSSGGNTLGAFLGQSLQRTNAKPLTKLEQMEQEKETVSNLIEKEEKQNQISPAQQTRRITIYQMPTKNKKRLQEIQSGKIKPKKGRYMEEDERWHLLKEELREKMFGPNKDPFFQGKDWMKTYFQVTDDPNARTWENDMNKMFKEKFSNDAKTYEEAEKKRVYTIPEADPEFNRTQRKISSLKNNGINEHIASQNAWDSFVENHPEKANAYSKSNLHIQQAVQRQSDRKIRQQEYARQRSALRSNPTQPSQQNIKTKFSTSAITEVNKIFSAAKFNQSFQNNNQDQPNNNETRPEDVLKKTVNTIQDGYEWGKRAFKAGKWILKYAKRTIQAIRAGVAAFQAVAATAGAGANPVTIVIIIIVVLILLLLIIIAFIMGATGIPPSTPNPPPTTNPIPGLTLNLSGSTQIQNNENISYGIEITYAGDLDVTITNYIPSNATFVSAECNFTQQGNTIVWKLNDNKTATDNNGLPCFDSTENKYTFTLTLKPTTNDTRLINRVVATATGTNNNPGNPTATDFTSLMTGQGNNTSVLGDENSFTQQIIQNGQKFGLSDKEDYIRRIYRASVAKNLNPLVMMAVWGTEWGFQLNPSQFNCPPRANSGFDNQLNCGVNTFINWMDYFEKNKDPQTGTLTVPSQVGNTCIFSDPFIFAAEKYGPECTAYDQNEHFRPNFVKFYKTFLGTL